MLIAGLVVLIFFAGPLGGWQSSGSRYQHLATLVSGTMGYQKLSFSNKARCCIGVDPLS